MVAEMRLRRDHGPRAGMVNSVSSSIRQANPLATRPPPLHALVTPEASLYVGVIYLFLSRFVFFSLFLSFTFYHLLQNYIPILKLSTNGMFIGIY